MNPADPHVTSALDPRWAVRNISGHLLHCSIPSTGIDVLILVLRENGHTSMGLSIHSRTQNRVLRVLEIVSLSSPMGRVRPNKYSILQVRSSTFSLVISSLRLLHL